MQEPRAHRCARASPLAALGGPLQPPPGGGLLTHPGAGACHVPTPRGHNQPRRPACREANSGAFLSLWVGLWQVRPATRFLDADDKSDDGGDDEAEKATQVWEPSALTATQTPGRALVRVTRRTHVPQKLTG